MITYLTKGERLWLWGRRWGKDNAGIGETYGASAKVVSHWLHTLDDEDVPEVALKEPIQKWELIAIARRRQGWSIREMARRLGVSHVTLINRERGGGDWMEVWMWWRAKGWPPPPLISGYRRRDK